VGKAGEEELSGAYGAMAVCTEAFEMKAKRALRPPQLLEK
jgi:hypothetical protein